MIFQNMDRIVFAGDSVTDMYSTGAVSEGGDALGTGYVRIVDNLLSAVYPEISLRITNSGIGGNTSRDLLERWERDVLSLNPQWVSICIGINDAWRRVDRPASPEFWVLPDEYEANLIKMLESLKGRVRGTVIMTPYYMDVNKQETLRALMEDYIEICRRLAAKYESGFIDLQAIFDKILRHKQASFVSMDRIHPNSIGATIIAKEFLNYCGFDFDHII